ncbi:MAG TPA: hypothetical protein VMS79_01380, partial [Methanomassiliicoccales archaeon]|nr:hypothetical protein [Methanomassiliicoccales archaeon]
VTAHVDVRAIVALNGKVDQIVQKLTGRPDVVGDVTVPSETRALLEAREKANDELIQEGYLQEIKYTKSAPPLKGRDLAKRPLRSGMDFKLI